MGRLWRGQQQRTVEKVSARATSSSLAGADCAVSSFGNFVNRVLKFTAAKYNSVVPDGGDAPGAFSTDASDPDAEFIKDVNDLLSQYIDSLDNVKLRGGLQHILSLSGRGNLYLQQVNLNNQLFDSDPKRCAQVIARALNLIYVLSVLIEPYMPGTAASICAQLNAPKRAVPTAFALDLLPGHTIGAPALLFSQISEASLEAWRVRFGGSNALTDGGVAPAEPARSPRRRARRPRRLRLPRRGRRALRLRRSRQISRRRAMWCVA